MNTNLRRNEYRRIDRVKHYFVLMPNETNIVNAIGNLDDTDSELILIDGLEEFL